MPNEQPILLSQCAGPNRILNDVVIYFQNAVVHEPGQGFPPFQHIINRLSQQPLGQNPSPDQLHGQVQAGQNRRCFHAFLSCQALFLPDVKPVGWIGDLRFQI
jgi:hypothetical protein